ncbi:MAG: UbiD family decarboxylase [Dehalococcoidia bacterium]|nr:UbiD family decarboxylase [Dehalococcoidia bacterium]
MPFKDLREYIASLEAENELVHVKQEVDWDLEAGAIIRRCTETGSALPLFEKIKDYPEGYRVFGDPINSLKRFAIAAGIPSDLPPAETYRRLMALYQKGMSNRIKPRVVSTGPCKENVFKGDDVDLYRLPSLMLHDGDGGRYIGTAHMVVGKDPDSDWVNWGTYRLMLHDRNHLGGYLAPGRDMTHMLRKYEAQGKPMEFAVAIGTEPVSLAVAMAPVPFQVSEVDVAGGIREEPVELVRCETVDLMVPATSEIVLEGVILPNARVDEGPFGEFTGYAGYRTPNPVYKVNCITHRHNPILTAICEGIPVGTGHLVACVARASILMDDLKRAGLPVLDVNVVLETGGFLTVVSTRTPYANVAHRIASVVWGSRAAQSSSHKLMVVNDDIDPYNLAEVVHAFATKCHPVRGHFAVPNAVGNPLMPYQNVEERRHAKGSLILYDCTWPTDWPVETAVPPKMSFNCAFPKHIQERVLANWRKYGFKD